MGKVPPLGSRMGPGFVGPLAPWRGANTVSDTVICLDFCHFIQISAINSYLGFCHFVQFFAILSGFLSVLYGRDLLGLQVLGVSRLT